MTRAGQKRAREGARMRTATAARHGMVRVNVSPLTLDPFRGALLCVSARAEEKKNDYPFEVIDYQ